MARGFIDTFWSGVKTGADASYHFLRSGVENVWEGIKRVGGHIYDGGKSLLNTVKHGVGEVGDDVITNGGEFARSVGQYAVDTSNSAYKTLNTGSKNAFNGSGNVGQRIFDSMEYFGKGAGNILGASYDGLTTGINYASGKIASPYPKSLYAPNQGANIDAQAPVTGQVLYGGQVDSSLPPPPAA